MKYSGEPGYFMQDGRKVVPGQRWQGVVPNGAVSIVVLWDPVHWTPQRSQRAAWGRITVILHEISGLAKRWKADESLSPWDHSGC
uniref:Uncharacterized protein n=1 Tax=Magnetococcus massalia (strain MO-1) TaxID=451514 RepID=A0A1S7LI44_MAGMO|nr:protein of unknown function [Candidatus Magnetococcus massalia]